MKIVRKKKMTLTEEQKQILQTAKNLKIGDILIINALAGCAKTTTLQKVAEDNPDSKFLYLAFNRNVVEEGQRKFPENTKVSTLHGFARGYTGRKDLIDLNMDLIGSILKSKIQDKNQYFKVFNSLKAYEKFCNSAPSIDELDDLRDLIREELTKDLEKKPNIKNMGWVIEQRLKGVDNVSQIHSSIVNSEFTTFATFLKEFVETADRREFNYDFIVLDESQDVSKLLAKFIISITRFRKYKIIIVGDSNQKIYGFLGNTDLGKSIKSLYGDHVTTKNLTQSFRFRSGSEIEYLSNQILKLRDTEIFGAKQEPATKNIEAYISRSTFPLLAMAIYQIVNKEDYYLYGGIKNFPIDEIRDIYNLYSHTEYIKSRYPEFKLLEDEAKLRFLDENRDRFMKFPRIKTKSLKPFTSFLDLQIFASNKAIAELENSIYISIFIEKKGKEFENISSDIKHDVDKFFFLIEQSSDENSNIVLSTIHKTKGLEFKKVVILKSLSVIYDYENDKWTIKEPQNGQILGLEKIGLELDDSKISITSNRELTKLLNRFDKREGNLFFKDSSQDELEHEKPKIDIRPLISTIKDELILNIFTKNIKEEYNILYVAITRAIENIQISNIHYIKTLEFINFLNRNKREIQKIAKGEKSKLLIKIDRKADNLGIVYNYSFISKNTLFEFLPHL